MSCKRQGDIRRIMSEWDLLVGKRLMESPVQREQGESTGGSAQQSASSVSREGSRNAACRGQTVVAAPQEEGLGRENQDSYS